LKTKILVSWSSGKDSAWALHVLSQSGEYEIVGLLTTVNRQFQRVAMHSTRRELLQAQADAVGLPLWEVPLPWPCSNQEYESAMSSACDRAIAQGVTAVAFGDLFLEDVRRYRESALQGTGLRPLFPLWGRDTRELIAEMIEAGMRARVVCVDPTQISEDFAGRDLDSSFVADLPAGADPCGENGEFHTFAYAGPVFAAPIGIESGEIVQRDGFIFADVLPAGTAALVQSGT
jgi:uncharacterized protein (TIGR00290 family)